MKPYNLFIVVQPGLEGFAEKELQELGISKLTRIKGALLCVGHITTIIRINLYCRTVSRVLVELGTFFADNFRSFQKNFEMLPWDSFFSEMPQAFCFRVSSYDSALYHEKAIEERAINELSKHYKQPIACVPGTGNGVQLIQIHIKNNRVTVRLDSSGMHLHKRGFNKHTAEAPLRETIAASLIYASGILKKGGVLIDPMCGSGTIALEAAMLQKDITWDSYRAFGFMAWKGFDLETLERAKSGIPKREIAPFEIVASDMDPDAVKLCSDNARRAGLQESIDVSIAQFSDLATMDISETSIIINPPWGKRLEASEEIYRSIFEVASKASTLVMISPHLYARQGNIIFSVKSGDIKLFAQKI